jgi:hypothetical protein
MAQPYENNPIHGAVELLKTNGFDGLAEAVTVLLNTAMVAERSEYLGAAPYERSATRKGYANGFKDKTLKTRPGALSLKVPQTRNGDFYPQSLDKGLRSERAVAALPVPLAAECRTLCTESLDESASGGGHPGDLQCARPGRG